MALPTLSLPFLEWCPVPVMAYTGRVDELCLSRMPSRYDTDSSGWRPVATLAMCAKCPESQQHTVKIDIEFLGIVSILVALFIEYARSLAMSFAHKIVFALASQTESFGCA